ncbi:MAG: formate dehydrogenase, partial [Alphaproteobacteria bacterium]
MTQLIYVPDDAAALSVGAEEVAMAVEAEIVKRGLDAKLIRTGSRGLFWLEPLVEFATPKGRIGYGPANLADISAMFDDPAHPHSLGLVEEIPYLKSQQRLTFARCGITDPLSLEDYESHGGLAGLRRALDMMPADIVEQVVDSGLRGRGGAGFPTGIKWRTVGATQADQKYIVCNADEGDSGTFADRMLMEGDPFLLIEGMIIAGIAVGATKGFVYIRSEYPHAFAKMTRA